jgi:hypothetical protein
MYRPKSHNKREWSSTAEYYYRYIITMMVYDCVEREIRCNDRPLSFWGAPRVVCGVPRRADLWRAFSFVHILNFKVFKKQKRMKRP